MNKTIVVLLLAATFAGCIEAPGSDNSVSGEAAEGATSAQQAATDGTKEIVERCSNGKYCAKRTITVSGAVSGSSMPVSLQTFNGAIEVARGSAGKYAFEAVLVAKGDNEAQARERLDEISFSWSDKARGTPSFKAEASQKIRNSGDHGLGASFRFLAPAGMSLDLSATTTNGPIEIEDVRTSGLAVQSTNGPIEIDAEVVNVAITTTNGVISAALKPIGSGSITLRTTNGGIELELPETGERGYDVDASTTNGGASITLSDGKMTENKPTQKHFTTHGYDSRQIKASVKTSTTNGGISVSGS